MKSKELVKSRIYNLFITVFFPFAASFIGIIFRDLKIPETNIVIVYILGVVLTARYTYGYVYSVVGAVLSTCLFNYFFTEPYFTLSVNDPSYIITFIIMTLTAILTSAMTVTAYRNATEAEEKEKLAKVLYNLTNNLSDSKSYDDVARFTISTVYDYFQCKAACLCYDENSVPEKTFLQIRDNKEIIRRDLKNPEAFAKIMENLKDDYYDDGEFWNWPIYGKDCILAVLRIPEGRASAFKQQDLQLLHSVIESSSLAMDRLYSIQKRMKSESEFTKERFRSNLLRAISHDLRTPLSAIMGTSEMLMDLSKDNNEIYKLSKNIYEDADWLHSMMENILSLTKIQDNKLVLKKNVESAEEIAEFAVMNIEKRCPDRDIKIEIPKEVLLVPMDAKLISQVLINLLDNAVKHTEPDEEISVEIKKDKFNNNAVFTVMDEGTGIAEADIPHIFEMFYTSNTKIVDSHKSVGLGLAICQSIVNAHGGTIYAENRKDTRGAKFVFTLPLEEEI